MSKRRLALIIGAAVTALAVAGGALLWVRGDTSADSQPTPTTATDTEAPCGQFGTPGPEAKGATTGIKWDDQTGWPLPISPTDGPAERVQGGTWSCYARTPSGAVVAAYVISMRASGLADDWIGVTRAQSVPGPGVEAHIAAGVPTASPVTPRGFQIAAYSDDRATVRYYLHTGEGDASCTIDVAWYAADWRLVIGDDGSTATGCTTEVPTTFTPWGP